MGLCLQSWIHFYLVNDRNGSNTASTLQLYMTFPYMDWEHGTEEYFAPLNNTFWLVDIISEIFDYDTETTAPSVFQSDPLHH